MADFMKDLREDLLEQFRGKENIDVLIRALGRQLQDVFDFYELGQRSKNGGRQATGRCW